MSDYSRTPSRLAVAALFTASLAVPGVRAQGTGESADTTLDSVVLTAEQPGLGLAQTSGSASRLGVRVDEVPASVSVVTQDRIAARGQTEVSDAITQNVPGVTSVTSPIFGTAFAMRGFQGNNSVMQVYDGTRLFPGRGNITFPFDAWLVERIEVLHGPASVMHGSGAVGGTIDVTPKRPFAGPIRQEVAALVDSDRRRRLAWDSGGSLNDRLSYRLNLLGDASDGWIDDGDSRNLVFSGSLAWKATEDLTFTLSADHADQQPMAYFGTPLRDGAIDDGVIGRNFNVADAENRFRDTWVQLRADWTPAENVTLSWSLYGIDSRRDFRNAETYLWDTTTDLVSVDEFRRIRQDQSQYGTRLEARITSDLAGMRNDLALGFDVNVAESEFADFAGYGARLVDPRRPDVGLFPLPDDLTPRFKSTLNQHALFAETRLKLNERWAVTGGLRYDWFDLERVDHVAPANGFDTRFEAPGARLGAVYNPDPSTAIYVQFAYATDPVNLPLLDYSRTMQDFDLTTGRQFEIGVKQSVMDGRGEWTVALYDIARKNLPVFDPATFGTQQVGQQSSRGIEVAGSVRLTEAVTLGANAAYVRARYDEFTSINWLTFEVEDYSGNVPILVPETSANLWGSWDFAQGWQAIAGLQLVGSSYYDFANQTKRPGYGLVNVGLDWAPDDASVLSLRVTNLLDKTYAEYLRTDPMTERAQAFLGKPRTLEVQYRRKF